MQNCILLCNVFVLHLSNYCTSCCCPSIWFTVCSASWTSTNTVLEFLSVWQSHTWGRWALHWMMRFQIFFKVKKKVLKITFICWGERNVTAIFRKSFLVKDAKMPMVFKAWSCPFACQTVSRSRHMPTWFWITVLGIMLKVVIFTSLKIITYRYILYCLICSVMTA